MEYQKFMPEGWIDKDCNLTDIQLTDAISTGEILQARVSKCDSNYNLYVDLGNNVKGVIPREEVEAINVDETGFPKPNICTSKVNKLVQFKVKDIDSKKNYILSRKEVGMDALNWITKDLQEGMVVNGIVKSIQPYGVFVEIGGGVVGLLHIEDISVARIKTPAERLSNGQKINVIIKEIDRKLERVILTYKQLLGTWEENAKNFNEGEVVPGIVRETEKSKNGIFIELKPNLVGMAEYKDGIEYGQNVNVYIKKIIPDRKKIKLLIV